jgi:hypothetical protein
LSNPLKLLANVIAGLDPAIHRLSKGMDARVKPAHDGGAKPAATPPGGTKWPIFRV